MGRTGPMGLEDLGRDSETAEPIEVLERLQMAPLFSGLPDEAVREIISFVQIEDAEVGRMILQEGKCESDLYILLSGKVGVRMESISPSLEVAISRLGPGDVLGETAVLDGSDNSATIVVTEPAVLARFSAQSLTGLCDAHPEWGCILMRNIATMLSDRLRTTSRRILNLARSRFFA